jgi:serine/threonine protein kinase
LNVQQEVDLPDIALYWAPEQVALNVKIEYITRLDWWSAGCILLEMLLGLYLTYIN